MIIYKIFRKVLFLLLFICLFISCQTPQKAEKISRLGMLSTQTDGAQVEFTAWVKEVEGDEKLGLEVIVNENNENYPLAIITLKDGQKKPEKEKNLCFRGQISKRIEAGGGIIYYVKEAELIECY